MAGHLVNLGIHGSKSHDAQANLVRPLTEGVATRPWPGYAKYMTFWVSAWMVTARDIAARLRSSLLLD